MSQNKPEVIDSVVLKRHADYRNAVQPEAHAVNFCVWQLLYDDELYAALGQNAGHLTDFIGSIKQGRKFLGNSLP